MKNKTLLSRILIIVLVVFIGFWLVQIFEKLSTPLLSDEELIKTHYADVNCFFLSGNVVRGDLVVSHRSECAGERAWFENDIGFCNLHDDRDHCRGWMAIKTGDLTICEMQSKRTGYFWVEEQLLLQEQQNAWIYDCYRAVANWRNDPAICDLIPYATEDLRQKCKDTATNWGDTYLKFKDHSPI